MGFISHRIFLKIMSDFFGRGSHDAQYTFVLNIIKREV